MILVRTVADLRKVVSPRAALVPTMGAFHEGHLQLMRDARLEGDQVVVSLFVNPTQFAPGEDFSRYPRDLELDAAQAEKSGVDILFAPEPQEVYPRQTTFVHVSEVTEHFEGAIRPGHFDGMATVVLKLFNMVRPQVVLFGLKDLQQCAVIRRMVEDLNLPIRLSFRPTVRESDGLAMSSRNRYLTLEERAAAPLIYRELQRASQAIKAGSSPGLELQIAREALVAGGFSVDYFELIDGKRFIATEQTDPNSCLIVAAKLGKTRLIDNIVLFPDAIVS